jgi:hypothetical protein
MIPHPAVRRYLARVSPHCLAALLAGLLGWSGCADAAEAQFLQVEVIVFRHRDAEVAGPAGAPEVPDFSTAFRLAPVAEGAAARVPSPVWQMLGAHELKLAGANRALARSGTVDVLLHAGWRQPAAGGRPVYVGGPAMTLGPAAAAESKPAFEGAVSVARAGAQYRLGASFVARSSEADIVLREIRALKLDELHYLDHPLWGVLVEVTPWTDPAAADGPAAAAESLSLPLEPRAPQTP